MVIYLSVVNIFSYPHGIFEINQQQKTLILLLLSSSPEAFISFLC